MVWFVGIASVLFSSYAIVCIGCEDNTSTIICRVILLLAANIMLLCASNRYEKLESRIKAIEDKAENNAKNIHQLSKKQSDKTIEYYTDEM